MRDIVWDLMRIRQVCAGCKTMQTKAISKLYYGIFYNYKLKY